MRWSRCPAAQPATSASPPPLLLKMDEDVVSAIDVRENLIDRMEVDISNYLIKLADQELGDAESHEVTELLNFVTECERIGDYAVNIKEKAQELADKEVTFSEKAQQELKLLDNALEKILTLTTDAFEFDEARTASQVEPLEQVIDILVERLRAQHIKRLKDGVCSIDTGVVYLDVLSNVERISDHCSNIAARPGGHGGRRGLRLPYPQEYDAPQPHQGIYAQLRAVPQGLPYPAGTARSLIPIKDKNSADAPRGGLHCFRLFTQVFQQRPEGCFAGDVEALLEPEGIGLGQEIDIDAGAQEPLVGQPVVGAGVDDHPPALVAEVEVGAALPGGALRSRTRLGGRRLFAGVGREGETGQGHPEQAEHDGKMHSA